MNIAELRVGMLGALLSLVAACSGETVLGMTDGATDAPEGTAEHADLPDGDVRDDDRAAAEDGVEEADGPSSVCGNGVIESDEECDLLNLDGQTCASRHRDAEGTLRCDATCRFDESFCRSPTCGDGTCDLAETVESCPSDCHDGCGDGVCEDAEDQFGCPADCGAVAIAASLERSCALLADGTVMCWGNVPRALGADPFEATSVIQGAEAISMSGLWFAYYCGSLPLVGSSESHACALLVDGTVSCWAGYYGPAPVAVTGMSDVVALSAGTASCPTCVTSGDGRHVQDYSCAVLLDGTVRCWWVDDYCSAPFVSVPGVEDAVDVSAGGDYSCAILADGSVECWGSGEECGVSNPGIAGAVDITVGRERACAVLRDGSLECWACDSYPEDFEHPPGLEDVVGVSLGQYRGSVGVVGAGPLHHACVLLSNGRVRCWGSNGAGQLGDGTNVDASSAVPVYGLTGVVAVAAGAEHTCAIVEGGSAWCWGNNESGRLGDGTTTDSNVPVQVAAW